MMIIFIIKNNVFIVLITKYLSVHNKVNVLLAFKFKINNYFNKCIGKWCDNK